MQYVMGIDVGSQGVRILVTDLTGKVIAKNNRKFPVFKSRTLAEDWFEQKPEDWWEAVRQCIADIRHYFREKGLSLKEVGAVSVDSTSGTVVVIDEEGRPLRSAIMYNDQRAKKETEIVGRKGIELNEKLGYRFKPSFALPKILWIKRNEPDIFEKSRRFIHAADYISGKLSGRFDVTDYSNALKTGFDLIDYQWPDYFKELGLDQDKFPEVVAPGEVVGRLKKDLAEELGLSEDVRIAAGMTDGTAALISSGAVAPGQWNTTIGTTLVLKGITRKLIKDPEGRLYCHKHPDGFWIPGGASNTGGECLEQYFHGFDLSELDKKVEVDRPIGPLVYPLVGRGERFPFVSEEATGFIYGKVKNMHELYQGFLEGVGFVERFAYELMEELGADVGDDIFVTGGAVRSSKWLQIRANILNKRLLRPAVSESAMGSAILAAANTYYSGIREAVSQMVNIEEEINPQSDTDKFDEKYREFKEQIQEAVR